MIKRFFLCFFALLIVGGGYCFPRIFKYPDPRDPHRYHHHLGDGCSEQDAIHSFYYWTKHGYLENGALPCRSTDFTSHCVGYTHYPPLPQLMASWNLQLFGGVRDFIPALQKTRVVFFLLDALLAAFALALITAACFLGTWQTLLVSALLGFSKGFWLYADNLYGHGYAVAIMGILIGLVLSQRPARPILQEATALKLYAFFVFLCLWVDWEPAPTAWLLPGCFLFMDQDWRCRRPSALRFFKTAVVFSLLALSCRLAQNAYGLGGLTAALQDWFGAATARSLDIGARGHGGTLHWNFGFMLHYLYRMAAGHFFMMRAAGAAAILLFMTAMIYKRRWRDILFFIYVYLAATSWNWIMLQHSIIHFFTQRYAVWPATLAFALFLEWAALEARNRRGIQK